MTLLPQFNHTFILSTFRISPQVQSNHQQTSSLIAYGDWPQNPLRLALVNSDVCLQYSHFSDSDRTMYLTRHKPVYQNTVTLFLCQGSTPCSHTGCVQSIALRILILETKDTWMRYKTPAVQTQPDGTQTDSAQAQILYTRYATLLH